MGLFDKIKFKNKDKVAQYREMYMSKKIALKKLPKDVLFELLDCAIQRIDRTENIGDGEIDERDIKDIWCDFEFIVDDLFADLEEQVKLDIYK